jgi:5-methylthioribose kinase
LLHHDSSSHVLTIEDLGDLQTLDKWLELPDLMDSTISNVGCRLGHFLADFHMGTTSENRLSLRTLLKNDDVTNVVFSAAVEPILSILKDHNISDALNVYEIVKNEFERTRMGSDYDSVNLGDLWTGTILLSEDGGKIGVIDWEFSTVACSSQDIGQFGLIS